jgi:hypothetical protein
MCLTLWASDTQVTIRFILRDHPVIREIRPPDDAEYGTQDNKY